MTLYRNIKWKGRVYIEVAGFLFTQAEVNRAKKRGKSWKADIEGVVV